MSRFYVGDDASSTASDNSDIDTLPYPTPLQRNDFLVHDFSPATYLSTLSNRHQTLEDLRSELRARSQLLSKELLDLVNSNYQDFLNLGNSLHGGEEKVEEVRVGLLGFRKEIAGLNKVVQEREEDVGVLLEERRDVRGKIEVGRRVVEFDERVRELEEDLDINGSGKAGAQDDISDSEDDEDDDDEDANYGIPIAKLRRNVMQYRLVQGLEKSLGEHPFVAAQAMRMGKVRATLLLDLSTALQQSKSAGAAGSGRVVKVMKIYADMEESAEAIKVLKSSKAS
ncbi:oligomeric golgi complex component, COG2-domain-containing protein [Paraphoma chrysanthemicola]|uniref:Conserved oligomeric Golgi complex subunit 2 n=1 Tax=Paraphoma chrysanthemicola TaxID=798071 RepID=A0A8K0QYG7_9PLEO|nr:oligomeric golgi complex component, COG2-domain-containing protein [Paraphoma chrysanthemicola]